MSEQDGRAIAHEFEQVSGRVWTVDGSDSNTLHLALGCPHVDERLIHGDFDLNADGPRAIHIEDVSEEFLADSTLCGTCERMFPEEVRSRGE